MASRVQATGPLFGTMQALLLGAAAVGMGLKAGSYPHRVFPSSDAYTFYKISGAAYCNVTGWTCAPCLASNQSVLSTATFQGKKSDTRVFVAAYKDKITGHDSIVLSIRGTSSLTNWIEVSPAHTRLHLRPPHIATSLRQHTLGSSIQTALIQ